ncbi:uncharacterized protein LOC131934818 [Physella acuta]|uniref:uncharacterized protein LOC131934818 n=1 Tax=Physella acuta TaxID=109671 RepID=UPI0027DEA275|nr:uncharacterized protein LOC131934818 [Physella acuta]
MKKEFNYSNRLARGDDDIEHLTKQEVGVLLIICTCIYAMTIMCAVMLCFKRREKKKTIIQLHMPECKHKHGLAQSRKGSRALVVKYLKSRDKHDRPVRSKNVRVTIREPHPDVLANGGLLGLDSSEDISSSSEILQTVDLPPALESCQPIHTIYDLSKPKKKKEGAQPKQEDNKLSSEKFLEKFRIL